MIGLPASWPIHGAVVAAAFIVGAGAGWTAEGWRLNAKLQELRAEHAGLVFDAAKRTAAAQLEQRTEEARRVAAQQEIAHVASISRTRDQADRRAADVQHQRMLDAAVGAAVSAGRACQDPSATGEREAAAGTVRTLADVLGEADATSGEMAAAADAARTAGLACERSYSSLTVTP